MTRTDTTATTVAPSSVGRTNGRRRRQRESGPVVTVIRLAFLVLYGLPVVWIVLTSLKNSNDVDNPSHLLLFTPTLDAYRAAVDSGGLVGAGLQSFLIAFGATCVTIIIAVPAAYGLARLSGRLAISCLTILVVLQMIPQTATVIPLFQVLGNVNLLNSITGVILADAGLLVPWATLLMRPFFRAVPAAVEESAAIDGAGSFRTFRSISLPAAANGVLTTATLVFMLSWGEFLYAVNFLLSPGKYPLSATLVSAIGQYSSDWPGLMALAVVTSIPILVLFIASYRLLREGLTLGAVK